uniref:Dihydroflavonol-4-reductase n=1 Tax=Candidatus Kentrum sp. MB TaxID=2138164 RepID=A0A450XIS6_9GAMM|nr:MAG: dihydroflavonol-4-reductase [Candidatus Kentron sp. MB]VFK74687.1 MAG: dihydroflavonol-4-reductase [Candidatus Kentron sp. MB]
MAISLVRYGMISGNIVAMSARTGYILSQFESHEPYPQEAIPRYIYTDMNIFITGATGFLGKELVKVLSHTKHTLHCLARETSDIAHLKEAGARIIIGDVTHKDSLRQGMEGCQWVMHLANIYSFWEPDRSVFQRVNVDGTRNVMECAMDAGIAKVIHVSTCATYGCPAQSPFTEDSEPGQPLSEYARTKHIGDEIAWKLHQEHGLPIVMILPAPILGAGDPKATGQYVSDLLNRRLPATMLHDASMTFVHVLDVAVAILKAAEKEGNIGERYLLGKYRLSVREMNEMVRDISGVSLPIFSLPDFLVMPTAGLFTLMANTFKIPPPWGMSVDQIRSIQTGIYFDGMKAEQELGITYTPLYNAIEAMVREEMPR